MLPNEPTFLDSTTPFTLSPMAALLSVSVGMVVVTQWDLVTDFNNFISRGKLYQNITPLPLRNITCNLTVVIYEDRIPLDLTI